MFSSETSLDGRAFTGGRHADEARTRFERQPDERCTIYMCIGRRE
jgi:hypothetical protein